MGTLITDWSMYQSVFRGNPYSPEDKYNPDKWVVNIDFNAVAQAVQGVIIRVGIGFRKDPTFDRYLAGLKAAGVPWGIYHAFWPGLSPTAQAHLVKQWCPEEPPLGVWADLEISGITYVAALAYLVVLDSHYARPAGIYSNGPDLDAYFTAAQQAALSARKLWIAGYPNYLPTHGWGGGKLHVLHQYTDAYLLPGLSKPCDISVLRDGLSLADLLFQPVIVNNTFKDAMLQEVDAMQKLLGE